MNRLVTFGCSHTFGQALPDVWDSKKEEHLFHNGASKYAWPQLLANKLNISRTTVSRYAKKWKLKGGDKH